MSFTNDIEVAPYELYCMVRPCCTSPCRVEDIGITLQSISTPRKKWDEHGPREDLAWVCAKYCLHPRFPYFASFSVGPSLFCFFTGYPFLWSYEYYLLMY